MRKLIKKSLLIMSLGLGVFLIVTLLIPYLVFLFSAKDGQSAKNAKVLVIGHRGASGTAPENTLVSFAKAIDMGVDMVELDVHLTADDSVIVMHDYKVDRTTNGKGEINTMRFDELRKLDAGKWFDAKFSGEKIPTLAEVLELVKGRTKVLVELKWPSNGLYPDLIAKVSAIVRQHHAQSWVILQSFENSYLVEAGKISPDIKQQQLVFGKSGIVPFYFDRKPKFGNFQPLPNSTSVNIFYLYASTGFIKQMHDTGKTVYAFTPNEENDMVKLINKGVDGIITNYPERALRILGRSLGVKP